MSGPVFLEVSKDELTGGIQLSIGTETEGYRIAGPKFCGMSKTLKKHELSKSDVAEIRAYLRKVK